MKKATLAQKQNIEGSQKRLEGYKARVAIVSKAKVYESDKEIAEVVNTIPTDRVSVKRFRSYSFCAQ